MIEKLNQQEAKDLYNKQHSENEDEDEDEVDVGEVKDERRLEIIEEADVDYPVDEEEEYQEE